MSAKGREDYVDSGISHTLTRRQALATTAKCLAAAGGAASLAGISAHDLAWAAAPRGLSAANLRLLQAEMNAATRIPVFNPRGPAFNAQPAKGKSVFYLSVDSSIPIVQQLISATSSAAQAAGLKLILFDGKGQQSLYVTGMQQAIARKVDLILIESVASGSLEVPIQKARAAGIKVVVLNELNPIPGIDGHVTLGYLDAAKLEADWILADSLGKNINVVVLIAPHPTHFAMLDTIKKRFDQFAHGSFKLRTQVIGFADWQTRTPVIVRTLLTSDPAINYFLPVVDGQSLFIVPTLHQAGFANKVKISTFNATIGVIRLLAQHNVIGADCGQDTVYAGWAYIDQALRLLTGHPPLTGTVNEGIPNRMFDLANIGSVNINAPDTWFDNSATQAGFKKLWGVG